MLAKTCTRDVLMAYNHVDKYRSGFEQRVALAVADKYRMRRGNPMGSGKKLLSAQKNRPR